MNYQPIESFLNPTIENNPFFADLSIREGFSSKVRPIQKCTIELECMKPLEECMTDINRAWSNKNEENNNFSGDSTLYESNTLQSIISGIVRFVSGIVA